MTGACWPWSPVKGRCESEGSDDVQSSGSYCNKSECECNDDRDDSSEVLDEDVEAVLYEDVEVVSKSAHTTPTWLLFSTYTR